MADYRQAGLLPRTRTPSHGSQAGLVVGRESSQSGSPGSLTPFPTGLPAAWPPYSAVVVPGEHLKTESRWEMCGLYDLTSQIM